MIASLMHGLFLYIYYEEQFSSLRKATTPTLRQKNAAYQSNVIKRGNVKTTLKQKPKFRLPVTYWAMSIVIFAIAGGALLQVLDLLV
ncbi:hypothetical protein BDF14DRAFT_1877183 [Spinellus fusiger]|nr:hypothetical protein BDF14DRAFT_1877183 [Spinellus fusiger]